MAKAVSDIRSLPLHELLSAPITAAMEAQEQASLGLVSLIQDVGFNRPERGRAATVRMVEFRYTREGRNEDGKPVKLDTKLRVPLLSMISLPNLEIERVNVTCLAGVQALKATEFSPQLGISADLQKRYPFLRSHAALNVTPASRASTKSTGQTAQPYHLEITLTATNEEPTEGVQRLLTALGGTIVEEMQ